MMEENGSIKSATESSLMSAMASDSHDSSPTVSVRIYVPELNVQKVIHFHREELVWNVKQQCLATLPKVCSLSQFINSFQSIIAVGWFNFLELSIKNVSICLESTNQQSLEGHAHVFFIIITLKSCVLVTECFFNRKKPMEIH